MKYIKILIALCSISVYGQDSRLFENTWYLHHVTIDGTQYFSPVNLEIPYVPAIFTEPDWFDTGMCSAQCSGQIVYNGTSEFNLPDFPCLTGACSPGPNEIFNQRYLGFYYYEQSTSYSYSITENGTDRTLIVVRPNGNIAVFGNQLLSSKSFSYRPFSVFPNPTHGTLTINNESNLDFSRITIRDTMGKLLQTQNVQGRENQIDIQELPSGIYLISFETDSRVIDIQKIVKI